MTETTTETQPTPEAAPAPAELLSIVVGYVPEDDGERALDRAADLAQRLGARLHVITVIGPLAAAYPVAVGAETLIAVPPAVARDDPGLDAQAQELLRHADALIGGRALAEFHWSVGDPAHEIVDLAHDVEADMIVVGDHKRGFLGRLLERSVAHAVSTTADCDVLIVRPSRSRAREGG